MFILIVIVLSACNNNDEGDTAQENEDEEGQAVDVDKGLMNVEVTFPAEMFADQNIDEVIANAHEQGVSEVIQNDDGSFTYKMSRSTYNDMLRKIEESVKESVDTIKEKSTSIREITHNDDMSEFKLIVNQKEYENSFEGFVSLTLGVSGMYYQVFSGEDADDVRVTVQVEDEKTGNVIDTINFPEVLNNESDDE